jgi:Skp family chaperone for outer membrane proteins
MAGAFMGMGFQATAPKFATVDMPKVFDEADLTKTGQSELNDFVKSRLAVIQFLKQNPPMLPTDAEKYAELYVKATKTPADQTELSRITADAQTATQKQHDLAMKSGYTADEQKLMTDYSSRVQLNQSLEANLEQRYDKDTHDTQLRLHDQAMEMVKHAVTDIASKKGYTVVFSTEAAPFASNDITDEAVKAVGGKAK